MYTDLSPCAVRCDQERDLLLRQDGLKRTKEVFWGNIGCSLSVSSH
jgi:hypothetical protein